MKMLKWIAAILALVVVVSGLLLLMFSGSGSKELPPESIPESVRSLPLERISTYDDFIWADLQEATLVNGFPCGVGSIYFTRSGQLLGCSLTEDTVIQGNLITKGTEVELNEELEITRIIQYFYEDTEIQIQGFQVLVKAKRLGGTVSMPVSFYPNGRLRQFYSPSNVTIDGIPCRRFNSGWMSAGLPKVSNPLHIETAISLYENGNVRRCTLSSDTEIGGRSISAGKEILIAGDGQVTIQDDSKKRRMGLRIAELFD